MTRPMKATLTVVVIFLILVLGLVLLVRSMIASAEAEAVRQNERWRAVAGTGVDGRVAAVAWPVAVPDAENAAAPLRSLHGQFNALSVRDRETFMKFDEVDRDVPRIRELLEAHPALLEDALEACARPSFRPDGMTIDHVGFDGEIGDLMSVRIAMRILAAGAHERVDRGDTQGALELLQQSMHLTDHVRRLPLIITALVALAGDQIVLNTFELMAREHGIVDHAGWIDRLDPAMPLDALRAGMIGEAEFGVQGIEALHKGHGVTSVLGTIVGFRPARSQARYLEAMAASLGQLSVPVADQDWTVPDAIVGDDRIAGMYFPAMRGAVGRAAEQSRHRAALQAALRVRAGHEPSESAGGFADPVTGEPLETVVEEGRIRVEVGPVNAREVLLDWPLEPGGD